MKDTVKLKFLEVIAGEEEDLCTCILVDDFSRKIFLTLTAEEGKIVKKIVNEKHINKKKQYSQEFISENIKNFIKNDYKIQSAKIEVGVSGEIGTITFKKKYEKFNVLSGFFTIILLMLSENLSVFTSINSFNFCSVRENIRGSIWPKEDNDKNILGELDFFIEQENCGELKKIFNQLKDKKIDIKALVSNM